MAPILGYWAIRGLAEPIRMLLKYLGVEYEEKMYSWGPAPDYDPSQWFNEKFTLGLDFPNLPYYIDGDFKLTQSLAILEYIADKHDMIPNCKKTRAIFHMLHNDIMDVLLEFGRMCYGIGPANAKEMFLATLPKKLENYVKYMGDHDWISGEKINYPDFLLAETVSVLLKWDAKVFDEFPELKAFLHRFENLPGLKDYMTSKELKTRPYHSVTALWRGDP